MEFAQVVQQSSKSVSQIVGPFFSETTDAIRVQPRLTFDRLTDYSNIVIPHDTDSYEVGNSPYTPHTGSFYVLRQLPRALTCDSLDTSHSGPVSRHLPVQPLPRCHTPQDATGAFRQRVRHTGVYGVDSRHGRFAMYSCVSTLCSPTAGLSLCTFSMRRFCNSAGRTGDVRARGIPT